MIHLICFSAACLKRLKKIIPPNKDFSHYLKDPANNTFYMSPTNAEEFEQKLETLIKTNKAVGPNTIPTMILKTYSELISLYQN